MQCRSTRSVLSALTAVGIAVTAIAVSAASPVAASEPTTVTGTAFTAPLVVNISDSYGAGNGARNYFETECFTSPENFARIVTSQIGGVFGRDASCGGATSASLRERVNNDDWFPANGSDVDLVFSSMGGNDVQFSDIAKRCLIAGWVPDVAYDCGELLATANEALDTGALIESVSDTLDLFRDKMPNSTVVLVGYPNLKEGHQAIRDLLTKYISQQQAEIARRAVLEPGKWIFIDRRELFSGHEVGSSDEWLWDVVSIAGSVELEIPDDIYHPKPIGWQATAGLIAAHPAVSGISLQTQAIGAIVRPTNSVESWLVSEDGTRRPLLDGGAFQCAYASNGQRLIIAERSIIESALPTIGDPASPVCEQPQVGDVLVDKAGRSFVLDRVQVGLASFEVKLRPLETTAAFRCEVNHRQAVVRRDVLATTLDQWDRAGPRYCIDPAEGDGRVVVDPSNEAAYQLERDGDHVVRRRIPDTETFKCLERRFGLADRTYSHEDLAGVSTNVDAGPDVAGCLAWQDYVGQILEDPNGRQVLVTASGQRGIRDGGTSRCLTAWEGRPTVFLDAVYLDSVPVDPAGWASCTPLVAVGQILRVSATEAAYRVNRATDGALYLRHIAESETYRCLVARGTSVLNDRTVAQIEAFVIAAEKEPACVNAVDFAGKIVKTPSGRAELIDGQGVGHLVPTGGAYLCLTLWAGVPVHGETFNSEQMAAIADGTPATCDAHMVAKNQIVTEPGGHSIYVDAAGTAHNIQTGHAYSCAVETQPGVTIRQVPSHEWQQAFSYGADQPGCEKIMTSSTGASYFQDAAGVVHWLRNTTSYWCAADKGYRIQAGVPQANIDRLPQGTWYQDCLSPSRYKNTIIRRTDGVAWVVDELGRRRHIPDGYSFECYKERGYRVAELNLNGEQANSIAEVGRMGYCLAKWQANGTIIRECGGTAYYVENNNRRHIPSGWTYEAIQEWGRPVLNTCLNWEHIGSLTEVGRMPYLLPKWRFRNTLVHHSSGAVFKTDGNACRYHVRDWWTVERLQELGHGFTGWNVNDEEINSLPYCGSHSLMLAKWRANNRVVRGPDGTSWFVRNGEWFWIPNGAIWNHLVRKYGLLGTFSWEHINSIKWDRGRWAGYW
jgi:hypothetical protein